MCCLLHATASYPAQAQFLRTSWQHADGKKSCVLRPTSTIGLCLAEMPRLDRCCTGGCRCRLPGRDYHVGRLLSEAVLVSEGVGEDFTRSQRNVMQVTRDPSEAPYRPWLRPDRCSKAVASDIAHESLFVASISRQAGALLACSRRGVACSTQA